MAKSYGHYCGIAHALDIIGDRWALLIVRELFFGPLRYSDLQKRLQGVATDMLATRLKSLEAAGVVAKDTLPPPAASRIYTLTGSGRELEPVLLALARFGLKSLGKKKAGDHFDVRWLLFSFQLAFRPGVLKEPLVIRLQIKGTALNLCLTGEAVTLAAPDEPAHVQIFGSLATLAQFNSPEVSLPQLIRGGKLRIEGERGALKALEKATDWSRLG